MTIAHLDRAGGATFIRRQPRYSRPAANLTAEQRLDYSSAYGETCPAILANRGEAPIVVTTTLGAGEVWDGAPDDENGSLVGGEWRVSRPKRSKTSGEIAAELAAAQAAARAAVKINAEAARMQFLTAGDGKALTYEAKRSEAARWAADGASPKTLTDYPFALREAAALNGLDPTDSEDLADVTEEQVGTVIAAYAARAAAFTAIGAQIEALEQGAAAAIDAADTPAAAQAAAVVTWPAP